MYNTKHNDFKTGLAGRPEQIHQMKGTTHNINTKPSRKATQAKQTKTNKYFQISLAQGAHGQTSLNIFFVFVFPRCLFFSKVVCFLCCCAALRCGAPLRSAPCLKGSPLQGIIPYKGKYVVKGFLFTKVVCCLVNVCWGPSCAMCFHAFVPRWCCSF